MWHYCGTAANARLAASYSATDAATSRDGYVFADLLPAVDDDR